MNDPAIEIAALKSTIRAQGIEIRDLKQAMAQASKDHTAALAESSRQHSEAMTSLSKKVDDLTLAIQPMLISAARLNLLLQEADRQDGMRKLAKLIGGGTFIALVGSAMAGIFHFFSRGGAS